MFSSLDRVDIVLEPGQDGLRRFAQSDHRTAAEIQAERELSTLFALVRVLNPKRMAGTGEPEPVVYYSVQERPPEFLSQAIHAAGGRLLVGGRPQPEADGGQSPPFDEFVESSFAGLARAVAGEYAVSLTLHGLASLEGMPARSARDPEEDEYAYWSAVLKLGSFGGEVIRASIGGRWKVTNTGALPFALATRFHGDEFTLNPLGKAIKRFTNGEEDSLVALVKLTRRMQSAKFW